MGRAAAAGKAGLGALLSVVLWCSRAVTPRRCPRVTAEWLVGSQQAKVVSTVWVSDKKENQRFSFPNPTCCSFF